MVESKYRRHIHFAVFLLPALVLYIIFFIYPFFHGVFISMTNWDGLTPRVPTFFQATVFEQDILGNIADEQDRAFLKSMYTYNSQSDTYTRLAIGGWDRNRAQRLITGTGFQPERNRFVGLQNYIDILTGNVGGSFYPRAFVRNFYNLGSALPFRIPAAGLERNLFRKLDDNERRIFDLYYIPSGEHYVLQQSYSELAFEDRVWEAVGKSVDVSVSDTEISSLTRSVKNLSLTQDRVAFDSLLNEFISKHRLSPEVIQEFKSANEGLFSLGTIKQLLAARWTTPGFDMGVIGFTFFFAIFSVIGINVLAFALALALDSGIHGQRVLRSVFFLPNILSMIIVALIWRMLFSQFFPRITGIDQWLSDAAKTPWLLVMVAVWQGAGYYMIVYLAGLQNIPNDVVEAASIDGVRPWQRFFYITLPLIVPAITISLFLTIANALKSFDLIYAMTSGSAYTFGTVPIVLDIYYDAFARKHAGLATAKAMLLFLMIFAITGLQLYIMKRKEIES